MDVTRPGIFKDRLGNIAEDADKVDPEVYYCFDNGYSPQRDANFTNKGMKGNIYHIIANSLTSSGST